MVTNMGAYKLWSFQGIINKLTIFQQFTAEHQGRESSDNTICWKYFFSPCWTDSSELFTEHCSLETGLASEWSKVTKQPRKFAFSKVSLQRPLFDLLEKRLLSLNCLKLSRITWLIYWSTHSASCTELVPLASERSDCKLSNHNVCLQSPKSTKSR